MVREWDPAGAPDAEVEAVLRLVNEALAADLPSDPPWGPERFREYLAVTMPGECRRSWLVVEPATGILLGAATVLFLDDMGLFELVVHPGARRRGVGCALLEAATRQADQNGVPSLGVEVAGKTVAIEFFEANRFRWANQEMRNILQLESVDWFRLGEMARGIGAGYRIEYHPGGPPEELYEAYALAKESTRGIANDLDLRPSSYEPQRLRASLATLHARGLKPYIVLAVHESTEVVAGLTEVVVPAQRPTRADQYDTIVVPEHRGYGLGRALKARMLFELRAAEPQLTEVQTWHALENEPLLKVNAELGFVADREWREYEADVADLMRRFGTAAA